MPERTAPVYPPSLDDLTAWADAVYAELPEPFRRHTADIVFKVCDFPDEETERDMELESPFDLMGLYQGVSLDRKSGSATPEDVDYVFLYRRPILDYWCETGEDLKHIVRHVLIHEIGHHLGFSDEDMDAIEAQA